MRSITEEQKKAGFWDTGMKGNPSLWKTHPYRKKGELLLSSGELTADIWVEQTLDENAMPNPVERDTYLEALYRAEVQRWELILVNN